MTSTAITKQKELFEKAELVSSNDPGLDPSSLVYISEDSEGSEKCNGIREIQETAHHEEIRLEKEENDCSNDTTVNPIHVSIKMEEELVIEMEPIEVDSGTDDDDHYHLNAANDDQLFNMIVNEPQEMSELKSEPQSFDSCVQFEIIPETETTNEAKTSNDTSLVDHPYFECEKTKKGLFEDVVHNMLKEADKMVSPTRIQLFTKFTELLVDTIFEDEQSETRKYLHGLRTSLQGIQNAVDGQQLESELSYDFKEIPLTQTESEKTEDGLMDEVVDMPETEEEQLNGPDKDSEEKARIENLDNDRVQKLKADIRNVEEFGKKLGDQAAAIHAQPLSNDDNIAEAKLNLLTLLKESRSRFRSLMSEIEEKKEKTTNEKAKKQLLSSDTSDSLSDSDSEIERVKKLKRKIPSNGPLTPAVVSSTKEDSDASGTEATELKPKTHSSSSDSDSGKPNNLAQEVDKLIDFSSIANAKPERSKKSSKVKKPVKKEKKEGSSDTDSFSSGDDCATENSSFSSDADGEESDEEKLWLQKRNEDAKKELLAGSESSTIDSDESDLDALFEDDEKVKPPKPKDVEQEKPTAAKPSASKSNKSDDGSENEIEPIATSKPEPSNSEETSPSDKTIEEEKEQQPKKKIRRDSFEREIFDKKFLEPSDGKEKTKPPSSSAVKSEKVSPQKTARPPDENGSIDLTMFENSRAAREIDIQKLIDKRNSDGAGPSTSAAPTKPPPVINEEDEDLIMISSDSESESGAAASGNVSRLFKRKKLLTEDELQQETKRAQKEEEQRVKRLQKKNDTLSQLMSQRMSQEDPVEEEVILDYDPKTKVTIKVHPMLVQHLKAHQREGIKFMYDTCFGSISDDVETKSGCILAHCMGLGKTLQLITLLHTIIQYPEKLKTQRILVICPKSTIMNWFEEFKKWLKGIDAKNLKIFFLEERLISIAERVKVLETWYNSKQPGVFLINYEAFRNLVLYSGPKRATIPMAEKELHRLQERICKCLVEPGPDLVACDEGHLIKNQKNAISRAVTKITTRRRIILTGTPIQNNLNEYYSMVDFIKPALLGTVKEFNNLYANPIKDGQHMDSTNTDIKRMKQRALILNKKLSKFVQRKEVTVLREFLPDKYEYCIFVPLTPVQEKLYENFLRLNPMNDGHKLLNDYTALRKIWTHPSVLKIAYERAMTGQLKIEARNKKNLLDDVDFEQPDDLLDKVEGNTGVKSDWWREFVTENDLESMLSSNKLVLLFEILKRCEQRKEKVLVFSAFVAVLNVVESFMKKIHDASSNPNAQEYGLSQFQTSWQEGRDYYRLDGSTKRDVRHQMIHNFNDQNNSRLRCFLISAKAGGQGINLIGANRCIILDTSWNPSSDQQNIFRIYRLGQPKDCFVYRLIALGTMEEKVYSRSVTKQAMSGRVVDKLQIDRHYRMTELADLYDLTKTDFTQRPQPQMPSDDILKSLLVHQPLRAFKYHIHDSLLENKPEQDLNEDDIKEAWDIYERELQGRPLQNGFNQPVNDLSRADFNNYLAAAAAANPLDNASGLFSQLFPPSSYFPADLYQNLMPFNISGAFRNNLVPTSLNAGTSLASTIAGSSLLRNLPNMTPAPFTFNLPSTSSVANEAPFIQNRRKSSSKQKSPSPINSQKNIHSLMALQNRYDDARPAKNSAANLSILPDIDPRNSPPVNRNSSISAFRNKAISKTTTQSVVNNQARSFVSNVAKKLPSQDALKSALNLSVPKPPYKLPAGFKPQLITPSSSIAKVPPNSNPQNLVRNVSPSLTRRPMLPASTATNRTVPQAQIPKGVPLNKLQFGQRPVAKSNTPTSSPIVRQPQGVIGAKPTTIQQRPIVPSISSNPNVSSVINSRQITVTNITKKNANPQPQALRITPKESTFVPQNRTSGSLQVQTKPQTSSVNTVNQNPGQKSVLMQKNVPMNSVTYTPVKSTVTNSSSLPKNLQSMQNNKQMQITKINSQNPVTPKIVPRPTQYLQGTPTIVRAPLQAQTQSPKASTQIPKASTQSPKTPTQRTVVLSQKRPIDNSQPSPSPKRARFEVPQMKVTPRDQRIQPPSTIEDIVEIE